MSQQNGPPAGIFSKPTLSGWRPGFRRVPWLALGAIAFAILAAACMFVVLSLVDGETVDSWKISPTVYLAVFAAVANMALHYAFSASVTTLWWVRLLQGHSNIANLHEIWSQGNSIWAVLTAGRSFSRIALASLLVTIIPLNGVLLQRAPIVSVSETHVTQKDIALPMRTELPNGFTGLVSGRNLDIAFYTPEFADVLHNMDRKVPLYFPDSGCVGTCTGKISSASLAGSCIQQNVPVNLAAGDSATETTIFETNVTFTERQADRIIFNMLYKPDTGCTGDLIYKTCTLYPTRSNVNVMVNNGTISLDPRFGHNDDTVVSNVTVTGSLVSGGSSTLGGIALALDTKFTSSLVARFSGAVGFTFRTSGSLAMQLVKLNPDNGLAQASSPSQCEISYDDPTETILAALRELMFRTAVSSAAITENPSQASLVKRDEAPEIAVRLTKAIASETLSVSEFGPIPTYKVSYGFLFGAILLTLLPIPVLLISYLGCTKLGHDVSLSPIEIAAAFNAPMFTSQPASPDIRQLLKTEGYKRLQYGPTDVGFGELKYRIHPVS